MDFVEGLIYALHYGVVIEYLVIITWERMKSIIKGKDLYVILLPLRCMYATACSGLSKFQALYGLTRTNADISETDDWRRFCPRSARVVFFPGNLCLKYGRDVRLTEAFTMLYISQHTTLPISRIFCAFERNGIGYIAMERLPGESLARAWTKRSEGSKAEISRQIREYIYQIRALTRDCNNGSVTAIDGGAFQDWRLPGRSPLGLAGPFTSVKQYHTFLRAGQEANAAANEEVRRLCELHEQTSEKVCLTHNDLSSFNILADGDRVTGIVDWECAAWLPLYWEYTSAWHVSPLNEYWQSEIERFLDPFPQELEMERLRHKYFGDY